jgi:SAM-dependent MidA family methyltransferase
MQKTQTLISIAEFMSKQNAHYYGKKKAIGEDFITSSEISQLFGEIIALWCITKWQEMAEPANICLVELGPGRGTLMQDLLRSIKNHAIFKAITQIVLVDINPHLRAQQKDRLCDFGKEIIWHEAIEALPEMPCVIIANEFFDCLPIKQYIYHQQQWCEIMIEPKLGFKYMPTDKTFSHLPKEGDIVEVSKPSTDIAQKIATSLLTHTGACLIIDYGYEEKNRQYVSSLQAVKNHQYHWVLAGDIDEADLSAHVNFTALAAVFASFEITANIFTQRDFLINYGIEIRAQKLYEHIIKIDEKIKLANALQRLISNYYMGGIFKVLEVQYTHKKPHQNAIK